MVRSTWVAGVTVTSAVPVTLPAAAATVVVPAARAVKYPVWFTVPTVSLPLDQVKATLVIASPFWSFAVAVNCCLLPTARLAVAGETSMVVRTGAAPPVE
ncbi:hypothetical protein DSECCO2_318120 [anaerobic digester metagenome]